MTLKPLVAAPAFALALALAACAGALEAPPAHAASASGWPPVWQDAPPTGEADFTPPRFTPPSASHCQRAPSTRELPGGGGEQRHGHSGRDRARSGPMASIAPGAPAAEVDGTGVPSSTDGPRSLRKSEAPGAAPVELAKRAGPRDESRAGGAPASADRSAAARAEHEAAAAPWPQPMPQPSQPMPQRVRPPHEAVTAGVVDDNADFGEYLAYRQRQAGAPVRERDVRERYRLEVTDVRGRPVHDAEVAVQRPGVAQPVMWARTDTAGTVWLHPGAFMPGGTSDVRALGVAVRKNGVTARASLSPGQASAVRVRLQVPQVAQRPRLDLVFMVDATGSMGDEIAKLKASMRAMSQQISQLPGQPDICYGLVAYRDRGDTFITRTHDFTDDLGAFQQMLARVQAGGGGDTPEALNEALHEVVHQLSWRTDAARLVVLVADAPPHLDYGGPQYDVDMQAALAKGIKLFAVGASGLDSVGEYVFRQMAQYTAGRFVFLTYKQATDPASGPGARTVHDVKQYSVQTLDRLVVRLVSEEMARLGGS